MPQDWNNPIPTTNYLQVLTDMKGRDFDAISQCLTDPVNPIDGMIKFVRGPFKFQERSSGAWVDRLLALAGGGTGAADAPTARTNLGLGTLATQDANNVNITGGVISVTLTVVQNISLTGPQDNLALTTPARILYLRCINGSPLTINGMSAGSSGDIIHIAATTATVTLVNEGATSTATNRMINTVVGNLILQPREGASYIYDISSQRWRMMDPTIDGTHLINIPAPNLVGVLPALNASQLQSLNGSAITSGLVNGNYLGSGYTGGGTKALKDNGTWGTVSAISSVTSYDVSATPGAAGNTDVAVSLTDYTKALAVFNGYMNCPGGQFTSAKLISNGIFRFSYNAAAVMEGSVTIAQFI